MTESIQNSIKSKVPFSEYVVGLRLDHGQVICEILSKSNSHVAYRLEGSRKLRFECIRNSDTLNFVSEIILLINLSEERFSQTAADEITQRVIPIFDLIFSKNIESNQVRIETIQRHIRELKRYIYRRPSVKQIIDETSEYSIWVDARNMVNFSHLGSMDHFPFVHAKFTELRAQGSSFIAQGSRFEFSEQLGAALAVALKTAVDDNPDVFQDVKDLLSKTIDSSLRTRFSFFTITSASFLLVVLLYLFNALPETLSMYIPAISGGILGAFISVQERSRTIKCDISDPGRTLMTQAFIRIVLGGIFGFIGFLISKNATVLSGFNSSIPAIILLGVISGFSERLIPEILQKIEKKNMESTPT